MVPTRTRNPFTGEVLKEYANLSHEDIEAKLAKAWTAFQIFRKSDLDSRVERILALSALIEERKEEYAQMITLEMGKTIKHARAELERCIAYCGYYAENAKEFLSEHTIASPADRSYVKYQPLGPLVLFQPWNFPFWLVFKTAIPQLLVGNTMLVKNAPNTPLCGMTLEKLFVDAGYEEGVYQYAPIDYEDVELVIADKRVRGVSLTGSAMSGRIVGGFCGKHIKKCVMELGGSDPFIVLDDADLDKAASVGVFSRLLNNAQACTNAKRFIVHEKIYDEFLEKVKAELDKAVIGDPTSEETTLGPLAKEESVHLLRSQVLKSLEKGAKVAYGDESQLTTLLDTSNGFFFTPMILEDIPVDCPAYNEELFGPVIGFFKVKDDQEAIDLANSHSYGLGAAVFGKDIERAERVAAEIESGMVNIND